MQMLCPMQCQPVSWVRIKYIYDPMVKEYPPIVKVINYNNIDDFFEQILNFRSHSKIDLSDYIFRGHSFENYKLIPTSLRTKNREKLFIEVSS